MQSKKELLAVYRTMALIREFEDRLHVNNSLGEIPGFIHLSAGHEAIATGFAAHITDEDHYSIHHRGHAHCLAKGSDVNAMMAELYGKETGVCCGKGGSMHVADLDRGILGANGIVGMSGPVGLGAGLYHRNMKTGGVSLAFAGDGASNHGFTFEALNLAVVLKLPMVFVFENNGFGEFTGHDYAVGSKDISARAAGFGLPAVKLDGTDYFAVYEAAEAAIARARNGEGPSVVEVLTARRYGHFEGDAMDYRSKQEVTEAHEDKDPLKNFRIKMAKKIKQAEFDAIHEEAVKVIDDAVEFARTSPMPGPEKLTDDVYVSY